jgi:hypothetical protein
LLSAAVTPEGAIDWESFVKSVTFVIDVDGAGDAGACRAAGGSADDVDERAAEPAGRGATTQLDLPDSAAPLIAVAQNS